jgi:hypothetical protein
MQQDVAERAKVLLAEGERIISEATKRDLHLRLLGSISFQMHCPKFRHMATKFREIKDIDIAGYGKESNKVVAMMRELGYADEPMVTALFGDRRTMWDNKATGIHVDIFFDKLEMCHTIDFTKRLSVDSPTISLADLLLEKMQIVKINEKDVKDTLVLLREHEISTHDKEAVNQKYISGVLAKDWGFYYTVTQNLQKMKEASGKYDIFDAGDKQNINQKIDMLLQAIEEEPKNTGWKMRAKIGTKKKWYTEVEDVSR